MTAINGDMSALGLDLAAVGLGAELGGLSGLLSVALGSTASGAFQPSGKGFTVSMPASGQASVDLGDGNTLVFNKSNSQMQIVDAQGNVTTVWGDPHLQENGQAVGTFYGTTTFQLSDGTNITVDTKPSTTGGGVYFADQVTVTRGSNAVVISNLDQQTGGGLTATSSQNGWALNATTAKGLVLEQAAGGNWISSLTGHDVTQADLDSTKPNVQAAIQFSRELGAMLGSFLNEGLMSADLAALTRSGGAEASSHAALFARLGLAVSL